MTKTPPRTATARAAYAHWQRRRRRLAALGQWQTPNVDPARARAHVEYLRDAYGIGYNAIEALGGLTDDYLAQLIRRDRPIQRRTEAQILAVRFDLDRLGADVRVGTTGTRRRLEALARIGYASRDLDARLGYIPNTVGDLRKQRWVLARTARAVRDLYDELWLTPGPSTRARGWAERRGWPPPLAWDDDSIDDATATPDFGDSSAAPNTGRSLAATAEDTAWLLEAEPLATSERIAQRLGYADRSGLQRALTRAGRTDLLDQLARNAALVHGSDGRRSA